MESSGGATGSNWTEEAEDLVHSGEADRAISSLESTISNLENELKQHTNVGKSIADQLSTALEDSSAIYHAKCFSLKAFSRALQIKHGLGGSHIEKVSSSNDFAIALDSQKEATSGDKMAKRSSLGTKMGKRLADITNSMPQPKSPSISEKLPTDNDSVKDIIDHLLKENMALMKQIQEKNKIREGNGNEIQNLRSCLQKLQIQNWTHARTNSQMLEEINMRKERLKALQHEIDCKEVLLKTQNLELKEAVVETNNEDSRRRQRLSTSRSLGSSTVSQQQTEKEAAATKRQSTSSRSRRDDDDDGKLFTIDEAKFPEMERRSISRPSRRAAEKIQSYKEIPLRMKLRRPE